MKNKPFSRIASFIILATALSVGIFGQQQRSAEVAPSVERLREHVTYLASDTLDGRRTGTTGANEAAAYIAGQFSRLGFRPPLAREPKATPWLVFNNRFPTWLESNLAKKTA